MRRADPCAARSAGEVIQRVAGQHAQFGGEALDERPGWRRLYIPAGGVGLVALTAIFGTGYYLS